jgi:hypothetical protein
LGVEVPSGIGSKMKSRRNMLTGRSIRRYLVPISAITFLLMLGVVPASADIFTSNLTLANITGFTAPYGQVVVTLNSSTNATVTFTANESNPLDAYLFGDGGSVAVNVNASTWALGTITGTPLNATFNNATYSDGGAGNEDGFGSFNQNINSNDGFTSSSNSISFSLTDTSGTWANAAQVLAFNASGFDAAAHLFVCNNPVATCTASSGAVNTGFVAENASGIVTSPEPSSVILFGSILIGVAEILRRRVQRKA